MVGQMDSRYSAVMVQARPTLEVPAEIDPEVYRSVNTDLGDMSADALQAHYLAYGRDEGRVASQGQSRNWFAKHLVHLECLEIGPFDCPVLTGSSVRYFDLMSQQELAARAAALGRLHGRTPRIDYVSPTGDLGIVGDAAFDAVLSAHVVEHQPDLVRHLREVGRILRPGGIYVIVIPDKRYCFDHFIRDTTIADVLDMHVLAARVHRPKSVIEHRAMTCHNDPVRHWAGDHGDAHIPLEAVSRALDEYRAADGGYVDVHAWQFHPLQFRSIMEQLVDLGLSDLRPIRVYGTLRDSFEFIAVLERPPRCP